MMKKVLHGLLVMGAAAVISVGASSYDAGAAGVTSTNYTVDYANQKIKVAVSSGKTNGNTKLYVAKATVTTKKKKTGETVTEVTTVKNGVATEYDVADGMTIDLASFAVTRDTYLSIWGNATKDPILVKLPAATTKMKAVVDATDATVRINNTVDPKNPKEISGTEFCTTNGVWADYTKAAAGSVAATTAKTTKVSLTGYANLGATLRFRVKASVSGTLPKTTTQIGTDANGAAVNAYVATGNFASNELKVKIPKTANGPKATIDYTKRTIKVPNTSEYRVQAGAAALGKFTAATAETKTVTLNADTLFAGKTANVEFDLRSAATARKPASKITEYVFNALGTIAGGNAVSTNNPANQDVTKTTNTIKIGASKTAEDIKVTKLTLNSKMTGTMTITNNSAEAYEFVVEDAQTATKVSGLTLPTVDTKVKGKVVAFNSKTGKPGVANIAVKSGQYVYVRKASSATNKVWSTPYVFYGVVSNTLG